MTSRALVILSISSLLAQTPELVEVTSRTVDRKVKLPGEFLPYESVDIYARVNGFVKRVLADRGSAVKKGQLLIELDAPEMAAQLAEAQSKVDVIESQRAEAQSKLAGYESTYQRLKTASETPGAISGNELVQAEEAVKAARAAVQSFDSSVRAAKSAVDALKDFDAYLNVTAPFAGVITERRVHPGALVGPGTAASTGPLLKLEQTHRLRLVVAVPETDVSGIVRGAKVVFTVPAFPGTPFQGVVARIAHSMDSKTRSMAVELEVANPRGSLAPGMYPEVSWPVRTRQASLLVPASSIVSTTERTFVIRMKPDGRAEWVTVSRGARAGDLVAVVGPLNPGDKVVKRGSDEIRPGTLLSRAH